MWNDVVRIEFAMTPLYIPKNRFHFILYMPVRHGDAMRDDMLLFHSGVFFFFCCVKRKYQFTLRSAGRTQSLHCGWHNFARADVRLRASRLAQRLIYTARVSYT